MFTVVPIQPSAHMRALLRRHIEQWAPRAIATCATVNMYLSTQPSKHKIIAVRELFLSADARRQKEVAEISTGWLTQYFTEEERYVVMEPRDLCMFP